MFSLQDGRKFEEERRKEKNENLDENFMFSN